MVKSAEIENVKNVVPGRSTPVWVRGAVTTVIGVVCGAASAASPTLDYSGYIRQHMSVNLQDTPSFSEKSGTTPTPLGPVTTVDRFGGKYDLQMSRTSAKLEASLS